MEDSPYFDNCPNCLKLLNEEEFDNQECHKCKKKMHEFIRDNFQDANKKTDKAVIGLIEKFNEQFPFTKLH